MGLKSMTGFGQSRAEIGPVSVVIQMRAVNHRFCDVVCKLPLEYSLLEGEISSRVKERLHRGRVEVSVQRTVSNPTVGGIGVLREELFRSAALEIMKASRILRSLEPSDSSAKDAPSSAGSQSLTTAVCAQALSALLGRREFFDTGAQEETSLETELSGILPLLDAALMDLEAMREREGQALERELLRLLSDLEGYKAMVMGHTEELSIRARERLEKRLASLLQGVPLDESRVIHEIALLADRADVTEELARLDAHFSHFRSLLSEPNPGKKLDFLVQELGREITTLGTKAQSSPVTPQIVEAKATLEKIREQLQNVV